MQIWGGDKQTEENRTELNRRLRSLIRSRQDHKDKNQHRQEDQENAADQEDYEKTN